MSYTITSMTTFDGMQILNLDKNGNGYLVSLYNKSNSQYTHKTFATIDAAEAAFLKIAKCFIRGEYSAADRAEMLRNS